MLKKLILLIAAALAWLSATAAIAGNCSATYSVSYSPNPIGVSIGSTVDITVTASPASVSGTNQTYEIELKHTGTFYGDFDPGTSEAGKSAKVNTVAGTPSATFTYTPPASMASYPGNSGNFEIKVKKKTGSDCDIKPSGSWPVTSVTVNNTCATALSMSTVPAQSVLGWNSSSGGTQTSLTYTPSSALTTGGTGVITYSFTILTTGAGVGNLSLDTATGGFTFEPASGYTGNYQFTLKADSGTCHAEQTVVVAVQDPAVCVAPTLSASTISVTQDTAFSGTSTATGGTLPYTYTVQVPPTHGTITGLNATTGSYTYTPTSGYVGADSFALNAASNCTGTPNTTATTTVDVGAVAPAACNAPTISAMSLTVPYAATTAVVTPVVSGGTAPYLFSLPTTATAHGTVALTNSSTGQVTYTRTAGYVGGDSFVLDVASSCGAHPGASGTATATMSSDSAAGAYGASGTIAAGGAIIIDNTPNPGSPGIVTNMATSVGGKNFGVNNSFNINGIQVMQRDVTYSPHHLVSESGVTNTASTSYENYGTSGQTTYFANGQHLFDLDRLRRAANWMRVPGGITLPDATTGNAANLMSAAIPINQIAASASACSVASRDLRTANMGTPIEMPVGSCHPAGTYGVITWREFLENIRDGRTMYGVVRILVPLQVKSTSGSSNNALNQTVLNTTIYGFCISSAEWCANAPTSNTNIKGGAVVGGNNAAPAITMPAISTTAAQLRVRGSLMFDFVNGTTDAILGTPGHPIPLANLPFDPRAIYFKVSVPINVNAGNDLTGDGVLDNIAYISGLTSVITCASFPCTTTIPDGTVIDNTEVPLEVIQTYNFQYGTNFTSNTDTAFVALWNTPLNLPNKYHMLMASGYVDGWYDAFQELNITAQQWQNIGFTVPPTATMPSPLTLADIRSSSFEDLPTYLYTGGLVDMHHHMNVSGLLYVPQSAEIEQKFSGITMYMNGAVIVRDGFFLEGKAGGITLISSDPQSFSSIKVNAASIQNAVLTAAYSTLHSDSSAPPSLTGLGLGGGSPTSTVVPADPTELCVGCSGTEASSRRREWVEIRPR